MISKKGEPFGLCGRHAEAPNNGSKNHEMSDLAEEAMPISQQIENIRSKISLKERYNGVLKEELEEHREGASCIIQDLLSETRSLRRKMMEAIDREKSAVQNALRTYRELQLVLKSKTPQFAIAWLDDKLFDHAKQLNELVNSLIGKQVRLQEVENMVMDMEKWPRPGSTSWEIAMANRKEILNVNIHSMQVKMETSTMIFLKYKEIREKLREEEEKYLPVIYNLESQLERQKHERNTLQNMFDDALIFESEAMSTLQLTEKEAVLNRRRRRVQMRRMRAAVEKTLAEISESGPRQGRRTNPSTFSIDLQPDAIQRVLEVDDRVKVKRAEIDELETWVYKLVDTMRVPNLNYIPIRFKTLKKVGNDLKKEIIAKEQLRNALIRQRNFLLIIIQVIFYTGNQEVTDLNKVINDYNSTLENLEKASMQTQRILNNCCDRIDSLRLGMSGILNRLEDQKSHQVVDFDHLLKLLPFIRHKIEKLVNEVQQLENDLENQEIYRHQKARMSGGFVGGAKPHKISNRYQRVPTSLIEELSDDDDLEDYKVPTRAEIKAKSFKLVQQRRGISRTVIINKPK